MWLLTSHRASHSMAAMSKKLVATDLFEPVRHEIGKLDCHIGKQSDGSHPPGHKVSRTRLSLSCFYLDSSR